MRLALTCMECAMQEGVPHVETLVEFRDDGAYRFTCDQGHEVLVCLQEQKFEVLFELGLYAVADGYYREAITTFAACLERFQEFVVGCLCSVHGIDNDAFNKMWKEMSRQSERQLGAYMAAHLMHFREPAPLLKKQSVELRNKAVHQGRIPSKEEAVAFGSEVFILSRQLLLRLRSGCEQGVSNMVHKHIASTRGTFPEGAKVQFLSHRTALNITGGSEAIVEGFETLLDRAKNTKRRWQALRVFDQSGPVQLRQPVR